jgi:hypothetical protein
MRILRNPDPAEGTPQPAPTDPTPPPAAKAVTGGTKTEREIQLEGELQQLDEEKKRLEIKNAELEDQLHTLTTPPKRRRLFEI